MNKKYTHFAIDKTTDKIVNGWEYENIDNELIKLYSVGDIKDQFPDRKTSEFKIVTKNFLLKNNINPLDSNNWYKITETIKLSEIRRLVRSLVK